MPPKKKRATSEDESSEEQSKKKTKKQLAASARAKQTRAQQKAQQKEYRKTEAAKIKARARAKRYRENKKRKQEESAEEGDYHSSSHSDEAAPPKKKYKKKPKEFIPATPWQEMDEMDFEGQLPYEAPKEKWQVLDSPLQYDSSERSLLSDETLEEYHDSSHSNEDRSENEDSSDYEYGWFMDKEFWLNPITSKLDTRSLGYPDILCQFPNLSKFVSDFDWLEEALNL